MNLSRLVFRFDMIRSMKFLIFFIFYPFHTFLTSEGNSTQPGEYQLRAKLIDSGCWPLSNVPEIQPILDGDELPWTVGITPYFEILAAVDDKAQT